MTQPRRSSRAGFTLVELLMVILIISMLVALLIPAVAAARQRAQETAIKVDMEQLVTGMEEVKKKFGAYPPTRNWSTEEVATYVRRAWPRMTDPMAVASAAAFIRRLTEAEALTFWIGGMSDGVRMVGFNSDPRNPFLTTGQRTGPLVGFTETRLVPTPRDTISGIDKMVYFPPHARPEDSAPYVYFAARPNQSYLDSATGQLPMYVDQRVPPIAQGAAVPYKFRPETNPGANGFVNPESFQIICAGIDNDYGDPNNPGGFRFFPTGGGYALGDNDNIVSFSRSKLGDAQ
jgi:general secretion pathway protein G